jgi:hypothetical protein
VWWSVGGVAVVLLEVASLLSSVPSYSWLRHIFQHNVTDFNGLKTLPIHVVLHSASRKREYSIVVHRTFKKLSHLGSGLED